MRGSKGTLFTLAEKCKSILASNWQGYLNTIKADAKASKDGIHTSKVKYVIKRGKPYIWVPENEHHNVNIMFDERVSFSVARPFPGHLATLLKSMSKLPTRVALAGDIVAVADQKVESENKYLKEVIRSELRVINESAYAVRSILRSSNHISACRSESLQGLFDDKKENYVIYKFTPNSCMLVDGHGATHEIEMGDMERVKADPLSGLSAMLVDGINSSGARRRALILFCLYYLNINARDAFLLSIDCRGFDLLGKVPSRGTVDDEYQWREFRFKFKEEAHDVEAFCLQLMEMEEEVVKKFTSDSGLGT